MGHNAPFNEVIMAGIYKKIEIEYNGNAHEIKPNWDFIAYLEEQGGINLLESISAVANRTLKLTTCVNIIKSTLNYAGEDVTASDIIESFGTYNGKAIILATQIIMACDFNPVAEDMAEGNVKGKKKAKAKS
jgi:hypothetical protein